MSRRAIRANRVVVYLRQIFVCGFVRPGEPGREKGGGIGIRTWLVLVGLVLALSIEAWAGGILQIRDGYFWDPEAQNYFIPRGIAYQSFNPPVGADQTYAQVEYDFIEFKKMYANSVRCEFVWNQVETNQGVYDWSKPDFLVQKAEEVGLKLFVLIGFQYAPAWFPTNWLAVNDQGSNSVVLCYENPSVRQCYSNYIAQVTGRYKNSSAIGAWILGNEYAYFDLWEPSRRYLGYDAYSLASFQTYLAGVYSNNIHALNGTWLTPYTSFSEVAMPRTYPPDRNGRAWHDLLQWRKKSIGDYVALGAVAAKKCDPNHLRTYSMVGGLFGEADAHYTCEDTRTIISRCAAAGGPLDFWAINNYAIAALDSELRSAEYGIRKHADAAGLPVLISETGHTSTENLHPDVSWRQAAAVAGQMWEALMAGAMGTHIFTWNDREMFAGGDFAREVGFGIVHQNRLSKGPVYSNVVEMFRRMEQLNLPNLLAGSRLPNADIQFFWSASSDMGWPRANHENIRIWSTLKRLGYQPQIIYDEEFDSRAWTNTKALLLSRCFQLEPRHLNAIVSNIIPACINVHASSDFPGQYDAHHRLHPRWTQYMDYLFGLDVTNAYPGFQGAVTNTDWMYQRANFTGVTPIGPLTNGYSDHSGTWEIWHRVNAVSGTIAVTDLGLSDTQNPIPALHLKNLVCAKTAINTVALGDLYDWGDRISPHNWDLRYDWLRAIYRDWFAMTPLVDLSGQGAKYIMPAYRICRNGSALISLLNAHTNPASVTLTAHSLLDGKVVENLTDGGIVEENSDGILKLNFGGDQYLWLYAYPRAGGADGSLVNSNPNKIWFQSAPMAVWPRWTSYPLSFGYDLKSPVTLVASFERVMMPNQVYAQSTPVSISGKGSISLQLNIPDADLNDADYISTLEGGRYVFHAWLESSGVKQGEIWLPARLLWGVRPLSLPVTVSAGNTYQVPVVWQELPSTDPADGGMPLARTALWEPYLGQSQYYDVVLELRTNGQAIASAHYQTCAGSGTNLFSITVPPGVTGPFTWSAYLRPAPGATPSTWESFENRGPGAFTKARTDYLSPWISYQYPTGSSNCPIYLDSGVQKTGYGSSQSAFLVISNPPDVGPYSGFGMIYVFPQEWALPGDLSLWTNYIMSCDFREGTNGGVPLPCTIEFQFNDAYGGQIHWTNAYSPGPDGWARLRASLDQFTVTPSEPFTAAFSPGRVQAMVVNIQMLQPAAKYVASIDNIRLEAPLNPPPTSTSHEVVDSFEDRPSGADLAYVRPWEGWPYSENQNAALWDAGIHSVPSDGLQSAYMVVHNPSNPGAWAGFCLVYTFPTPWALPSNRNQWTNYFFGYDFKEDLRNSCSFEMQVKSSDTDWIAFSKDYVPNASGWDSIGATLKQFTQTDGGGTFDPNHVRNLVLNVRMLQANATYVASFDNIGFLTPSQPLPPEVAYGTYDSIFVRIQSLERLSPTEVLLSWWGKTNRVYGIDYYRDLGTNRLVPAGSWQNLTTPTNGMMHAVDTIQEGASKRFYRIKAQ